MIGVILITVSVTAVISIAWASGINTMNREHPDYKGDDFLDDEF